MKKYSFDCDLAVIGGGPAGIAAAERSREENCVVLID